MAWYPIGVQSQRQIVQMHDHDPDETTRVSYDWVCDLYDSDTVASVSWNFDDAKDLTAGTEGPVSATEFYVDITGGKNLVMQYIVARCTTTAGYVFDRTIGVNVVEK